MEQYSIARRRKGAIVKTNTFIQARRKNMYFSLITQCERQRHGKDEIIGHLCATELRSNCHQHSDDAMRCMGSDSAAMVLCAAVFTFHLVDEVWEMVKLIFL